MAIQDTVPMEHQQALTKQVQYQLQAVRQQWLGTQIYVCADAHYYDTRQAMIRSDYRAQMQEIARRYGLTSIHSLQAEIRGKPRRRKKTSSLGLNNSQEEFPNDEES